MRWASAAVLLPVALACCRDGGINPVPGTPIGFQSGTRLRAHVRGSRPGARVLVGWRDTSLDADCTFLTAEDGKIRCVPRGANVLFTDELCMMPVAAVSRDCDGGSPPAFARATFKSETTCAGFARAYRVKAPTTVRNGHVYVGGGAAGACVRATQLDPGAAAYALEPVAPEELVAAVETRTAKTDQLGLEVLVADDGAREVNGLYDARTRLRCFSIAGAIGGGQDRCIPSDVAWATYAADAACRTKVAYQLAPSVAACPKPSVVVAYARSGCEVAASYFAPGDSVRIDKVWSGSATTCAPLLAQPALYVELERDHVFYAVGDALPDATYPRLQTANVGLGRLAVPILTADDGTPLAPARTDQLYDTTLDALCRVLTFPDGAKRCVPMSAPAIVSPSYSDPACTREVVGLSASPGCAAAPPAYAVRVAAAACSSDGAATQVVALAKDTQTLTGYYAYDTKGTCTPQGQPGTFVAVTGDVPSAALATVVDAIE